jgi:two-component system sensor histidine kinase AtoS
MANLLERSLQLAFTSGTNEHISIHRQFEEKLPEVIVDPDELQQVFLNLLLNAREAMRDGGELVLSTSTRRGESSVDEKDTDLPPSEIIISIHDNGIGMSSAIQKRLFTPFFTTRENGTGLGLAISQRIIQDHEGRVEVESIEGEGSTFRVILPAPHQPTAQPIAEEPA